MVAMLQTKQSIKSIIEAVANCPCVENVLVVKEPIQNQDEEGETNGFSPF
jgi:hypothetical protein